MEDGGADVAGRLRDLLVGHMFGSRPELAGPVRRSAAVNTMRLVSLIVSTATRRSVSVDR